MKVIKEFFCIQKEILGNGNENKVSEGVCHIKKELLRPDIYINGYSLFDNIDKNISFLLSSHPNRNSNIGFSEKEFIYLSELLKFDVKLKNNGGKYAMIIEDERYSSVELDWYLTKQSKEIIIIFSKRWQFENQPRSIVEDQLGEDITYIHGIWENPILPESIKNKIKAFF